MFQNYDLGQICKKNSILVEFSKNFDFSQIFEEISILVKFSKKNFDFFQKFPKITKNSGFTQLFEKFQFQ